MTIAPSDPLYAVILGIVQGLTEFLPVSSSAHLIVVSSLVGGETLPLTLNVALHVGTMLAMLLYFWRDWLALLKGFGQFLAKGQKNFSANKLFPALIVGSIPAAIIGILFEHQIEAYFHHPYSVILPLAGVGILLWWGDRTCGSQRKLESVTWRDGLLIGVAQALALIPGVSRSGICILAARGLRINRTDATRFAFLLGTPAMVGACLLKSKDILASIGEPSFYLGGSVAAVVGILAIHFLVRYLKRYGFALFAIYRLLLAVAILWIIQ